MHFDSKTPIKIALFMKLWNDSTVITNILPQTVSLKTTIKNQCLTNVVKSIFAKVWDSFPRQYSIISRNSYSKFDENSTQTRLAWSRCSRFPQHPEFILDCYGFGAPRQRRQPVNIPTNLDTHTKVTVPHGCSMWVQVATGMFQYSHPDWPCFVGHWTLNQSET
jgi:hypothetical protein